MSRNSLQDNKMRKTPRDLHSGPQGLQISCDHCWAPGDAVQVVIDTPFGPVQGPFQYKRRCILCGKEIG